MQLLPANPRLRALLAFLAVPLRLRHHGVGAVIGGNLRLRRRKADRHADVVQGTGIGPIDAARLEEVGVADLESDDARVRSRDLGGEAQSRWRLDVGEDADGAFHARSLLAVRARARAS